MFLTRGSHSNIPVFHSVGMRPNRNLIFRSSKSDREAFAAGDAPGVHALPPPDAGHPSQEAHRVHPEPWLTSVPAER